MCDCAHARAERTPPSFGRARAGMGVRSGGRPTEQLDARQQERGQRERHRVDDERRRRAREPEHRSSEQRAEEGRDLSHRAVERVRRGGVTLTDHQRDPGVQRGPVGRSEHVADHDDGEHRRRRTRRGQHRECDHQRGARQVEEDQQATTIVTVGEDASGSGEDDAGPETRDRGERDQSGAVRLVEQPDEQPDPEDRVTGRRQALGADDRRELGVADEDGAMTTARSDAARSHHVGHRPPSPSAIRSRRSITQPRKHEVNER